MEEYVDSNSKSVDTYPESIWTQARASREVAGRVGGGFRLERLANATRWDVWQRRTVARMRDRQAVATSVALSLLMVLSVVGVAAPVAGSGAATDGAAVDATAAEDADSVAAERDANATRQQTLVVDKSGSTNYTTILGAVQDATDGDTVEVRPGTYAEQVGIDDDVTLIAPKGATLDGSSLGKNAGAISVDQQAAPTIAGFTIENYFTGIKFYSGGTGSQGDWVVRDVTIRDIDWDAFRARESDGDWRLEDSLIEDNGVRGVVVDHSTGDWTIENTVIRNNGGGKNRLGTSEGIGVNAHETTGNWTITDSTIRGHTDDDAAAVVADSSTGDWTISETTLSGNGAGVEAWRSDGDWSIQDATIEDNTGQGVDARSATGAWSITGSSIRNTGGASASGNQGVGVLALDTTGAWSVNVNTITKNAVHGINATGATIEGDATRNWWNQAGEARADQCVGNVDCIPPLTDRPDSLISQCQIIDEPGRYKLAGDITTDETCIEIRSSDVSFDGQGHTLKGIDSSKDKIGIYANGTDGGLTNVTVTDVTMSGWSYTPDKAHAVLFEDVDKGRIAGMDISGGDHGIQLLRSSRNVLIDNSVSGTSNSQAAIELTDGSDGNTLRNNSIAKTQTRGLRLTSSSNTTVHGNQITGSADEHIRVTDGSTGNVFTDNHLHDSGSLDPSISVATGNSDQVFRNNTITDSGWSGISIVQSGSDFLIVNNTIRGNGKHGLRLYYMSNATVRGNEIHSSDNYGINLFQAGDTVVENNNVSQSTEFGIRLFTNGSTVRNNRIASSGKAGIYVGESDNNELTGNTVVNTPARGATTFPTGIQLEEASDNVFRNNTVENAYRGIDVNATSNDNRFVDNTVRNTGSATWSFTISDSSGTVVESLDIGDSTAANTELSFEGADVSIAPNDAPPANANAKGISRYVDAKRVGGSNAYLDLTMHYESGDLGNVPASSVALWRHDGSGWTAVGTSSIDTGNQVVSANLTAFSTLGAFGNGSGTPTPTSAQTTSGNGPGFGGVTALLSLIALLGALALSRRD